MARYNRAIMTSVIPLKAPLRMIVLSAASKRRVCVYRYAKQMPTHASPWRAAFHVCGSASPFSHTRWSQQSKPSGFSAPHTARVKTISSNTTVPYLMGCGQRLRAQAVQGQTRHHHQNYQRAIDRYFGESWISTASAAEQRAWIPQQGTQGRCRQMKGHCQAGEGELGQHGDQTSRVLLVLLL